MSSKPRRRKPQQQSLTLTAEDIIQSIQSSRADRDERVKKIRALLAFEGEIPLESWQIAWNCLSSGPVDVMIRVGERAGWQVHFSHHSTAILEHLKKEGLSLSDSLYEEAKKHRIALKQMLALQSPDFPRPNFDERELLIPLIRVGASEEAILLIEKYPGSLTEEVATIFFKRYADNQSEREILERLPGVLAFKSIRDSLIKKATEDYGRGFSSLISRACKAPEEIKATFLKELASSVVEVGDIESCAAMAKAIPDDIKLREKLHIRVKEIIEPDPAKMIDLLLDGKLRVSEFEQRIMMRSGVGRMMLMGPPMFPPFAGRW